MRLDIIAWGSLRYLPIQCDLRPTGTVSESNWQMVTVTALDDLTYDLLIEEPAPTPTNSLGMSMPARLSYASFLRRRQQ